MDINQEEKNKLSQMLRQEMARKKADELGVDVSDIMQRVHDGKSSWVKKSDVYAQLDKQRKLVAPQKVIRSLRGGRDSLVSRIQREIALSRDWSTKLARDNRFGDKELPELKTAIAKLENRTNSLATQLADVESRIDRVKAQDPVFAEAESVLAQVQSVREKEDAGQAEQLLARHKDLLSKYEFLRKSLLPHLEEARKYRLELQKEYWQIMQIRFKLQAMSIQQIKQRLAGIASHLQKAGNQPEFLQSAAALLQEDEHQNKLYRNLASHTPPSHIPPDEASQMWDCILPEMETTVDAQADLQKKFIAILEGQAGKAEPADASLRRMVFTQQKKR